MALSGQERPQGWVGRILVDREGARIGACTAVLADAIEGVPEWLGVERGGTVWLPASGAAEVADGVQVTVRQAEVASAPIAGDGPPSEEEKVALSRHYRVGRVKADALRRARLLVAGVLVGGATVAGIVLARRQIRARRPRSAGEVLLPGARGVVSAAALMTAPAAALVANVATRGTRLAAAGSKSGVATGATVGRAGFTAARSAGMRAGQVTTAVRAVLGKARESGMRGGECVGDGIGLVPEAVSQSSEQLRRRRRKLMGKITAALTLGVGYVLGSRAGRQGYEQLKQSAAKLAQRPEVQQARQRVQAAAAEKLHNGSGQGKQLAANARQRAMDARAKVRPTAINEPGPETDIDPYAMPGTGIPDDGLAPEADPRQIH